MAIEPNHKSLPQAHEPEAHEPIPKAGRYAQSHSGHATSTLTISACILLSPSVRPLSAVPTQPAALSPASQPAETQPTTAPTQTQPTTSPTQTQPTSAPSTAPSTAPALQPVQLYDTTLARPICPRDWLEEHALERGPDLRLVDRLMDERTSLRPCREPLPLYPLTRIAPCADAPGYRPLRPAHAAGPQGADHARGCRPFDVPRGNRRSAGGRPRSSTSRSAFAVRGPRSSPKRPAKSSMVAQQRIKCRSATCSITCSCRAGSQRA